jgi:tetrahydromethanopterin S-methyltransferase subunit F
MLETFINRFAIGLVIYGVLLGILSIFAGG